MVDLPLRVVDLPLSGGLTLRVVDLPLRVVDLPLRVVDLPLSGGLTTEYMSLAGMEYRGRADFNYRLYLSRCEVFVIKCAETAILATHALY